jgi:uncharacterized membrane protein YjfL (UPF0719 family)
LLYTETTIDTGGGGAKILTYTQGYVRGRYTLDIANYLISIVLSLVVGMIGFLVAYKLFDWMTPGVNFSDQLNNDNRSVAIFLAGLFIGLGLLLGSAIK